jgi:heme/copper-type cytochrome/quinol oxidase subunit 3
VSAVGLTRDERAVRQTSGPVLGMVVFVASEAMFFATFFGAYFTIYSVNPVWPPAGFPRLEPELATVLTVVLVSSSVTLQLGVRAIRRDRARALLFWVGLTILLGAAFLGLQLYDYSLLGFGVRDGIFGSLFYVMTGLHMAHVFGAWCSSYWCCCRVSAANSHTRATTRWRPARSTGTSWTWCGSACSPPSTWWD